MATVGIKGLIFDSCACYTGPTEFRI